MSYKKKNLILIAGSLLLLWICWNVAFIETITLHNENSDIEHELKKIENAPREIEELRSRLNQVKGHSAKFHSSIMEMRKQLLSDISHLADNYDLSLKSFPEYYIQSFEGIELTTSPIVLSGNFKGMVQLIYDFEHKKNSGKISSVLFDTKVYPRSNTKSLYLTLYIQSINL